ncbi:hypothetical protein BU17DRAFT_103659 [Hysterangium stoloniferum]|nr:hypothetical protein BU17DRAFT_103659 [Hysterangium stoloniferum]
MSVTCPSTEPAVPAFNQPLFTCPVEVLVMIISHIEDRCDLMSMAQVSEDFHRIIVSKWLDYIHIRCDPLRIDIWQRIASNPYLAARTRSLEIINESVGPEEYNWSACKATPYCNNSEHCRCNTSFPSIIPSFSPPYLDPFVTREAYEKSVLVLGDALKHMTRLRCFRWGLQLPVGYALESLLKSFGKRNDMDEFYLNLGHHDSGPVPFEDDDITGPVNLPLISPVPWHHESDSLVDWIVQFTALKHLQLIFEPKPDNFDLLVIWQRAYWPSLVELTLEADIKLFPEFTDDYAPWGGPYSTTHAKRAPSHLPPQASTIERLRIRTQTNYSGFIQPQTLSRLRSLGTWLRIPCQPFRQRVPLDIAQQIEYLECSISAASLPTLLAMTSLRVFNALLWIWRYSNVLLRLPHTSNTFIFLTRCGYSYSLIEPSHLADRVVSCLLKLNHLVQLEADFTVNGGM